MGYKSLYARRIDGQAVGDELRGPGEEQEARREIQSVDDIDSDEAGQVGKRFAETSPSLAVHLHENIDQCVRIAQLFSAAPSPEARASRLQDLMCCLPRVDAPAELGYQNVFRILIVEFQDAWNMDLRSVKRTCVHFVHPEDGRLIPFDTSNILYRDKLEQKTLLPLRSRMVHV